jgi:hypothetical protein
MNDKKKWRGIVDDFVMSQINTFTIVRSFREEFKRLCLCLNLLYEEDKHWKNSTFRVFGPLAAIGFLHSWMNEITAEEEEDRKDHYTQRRWWLYSTWRKESQVLWLWTMALLSIAALIYMAIVP